MICNFIYIACEFIKNNLLLSWKIFWIFKYSKVRLFNYQFLYHLSIKFLRITYTCNFGFKFILSLLKKLNYNTLPFTTFNTATELKFFFISGIAYCNSNRFFATAHESKHRMLQHSRFSRYLTLKKGYFRAYFRVLFDLL